ncbi:hypothetical protein [uncultured Bifidobacterium sp.]|uniref:hypothetical protein n=1 Tax=uncultured Bifidobacterium sp. TaxID=165187 RepID=UPI0025964339|nr:hypothetical protein [uncultured Bifidobacterium sp.]
MMIMSALRPLLRVMFLSALVMMNMVVLRRFIGLYGWYWWCRRLPYAASVKSEVGAGRGNRWNDAESSPTVS